MADDQPTPPATAPAQPATAEILPHSDAAFDRWLTALPQEYRWLEDTRCNRAAGQIILTYERVSFEVPQALTEKLLRHGYVFLRAGPKQVVFQQVRQGDR